MPNPTIEKYNILLAGEKKVGKSQIIFEITGSTAEKVKYRFNHRQFHEIVEMTVTSWSCTSAVDETVKKADGFMFVFDLTNQTSLLPKLQRVEKYISNIRNSKDFPMILVGNKCDLNDRNVAQSEIIQFCNTYSCRYFEISALTGYKVVQAFEALVECMRTHKRRIEKQPQQSATEMVLKTINLAAHGLFSSVGGGTEMEALKLIKK